MRIIFQMNYKSEKYLGILNESIWCFCIKFLHTVISKISFSGYINNNYFYQNLLELYFISSENTKNNFL